MTAFIATGYALAQTTAAKTTEYSTGEYKVQKTVTEYKYSDGRSTTHTIELWKTSSGNIERKIEKSVELDAKGQVQQDVIATTEYDIAGNSTKKGQRKRFDGESIEDTFVTSTFDANGTRLSGDQKTTYTNKATREKTIIHKLYNPKTGKWVEQREIGAQASCSVYTGWQAKANLCSELVGRRFGFTCPPNGTLGDVWGTGVYWFPSSVCSAAVHAGLITTAAGGKVIIEILPLQKEFTATERHGVISGYMHDATGFIFTH